MNRPFPSIFMAMAVLAVLIASCSSNAADVTTSTTTTTLPPTTTTTLPTTTTRATTTTTIPEVEVSDAVNGLPADPDLIDRRVVAIKIDNHRDARPQSGVEQADAVYEILVEGGITRLLALFHQTDVDYVGPNRSGRPTDATLVSALAGAPFQISGAQGWVQDIFRADGLNVVYDNGTTTYRMPHRSAPHNLYTSSILIRDWADAHDWPDENPGNLFTFGEATPGEASATDVTIPFSGSTYARWEWDGTTYARYQGSEPHMWVDEDGASGQLTFDTVIALVVDEFIARNPAGSGTTLPTAVTVGSGDAYVFTDGQVISGTWERESEEDRFTLYGSDGEEIVLAPARLWISLVPDTQTITWE
jgi:Protein of unknown function (DUF3048) N-terminal domain/Protein of unknown function (DUF3048) C-terminal domain